MLPVFFSLQKSFSLNSEWFLGRVSLVRVFSFPFQHFKYLLPLPSDLQNFCWKLRPYGFPFYVILIFLLLPIKLSLQILQFQLWSILGGGCILDSSLCTLHAPWTWISVSFFKLRKFIAIWLSNIFLAFFSLSFPSISPIMQMLLLLMLNHRSLKLSSFKGFPFSLVWLGDFYYCIFQIPYVLFCIA